MSKSGFELTNVFREKHLTLFAKINKLISPEYLILDAGTLLSIIRDGKLFSWDSDIDFVLRKYEFDLLIGKLSEFKGVCNQIQLFKIDGMVYRIAFFIPNELPVSINRHVLIGDNYVVPYYVPTYKILHYHYPRSKFRNFLSRLRSLFAAYFFCQFWNKEEHSWVIEDNVFTANTGRIPNTFFWTVIPKKYYEELKAIRMNHVGFNYPFEVENYLTAHYGNWQVENRGWKYFIHDGTNGEFKAYNIEDYR